MYDKEYISKKLKKFRTEKNISANQLSTSLDLNPTTISKIETAKAYPSFDVFFRLCQELNISPSEFFNDSTTPLKLTIEQAKLLNNIKTLDEDQLKHLNIFINSLKK